MTEVTIETIPDAPGLATRAAQIFSDCCRNAVAKKNSFTVALSGGSTPRQLYELLADEKAEFREQIPWNQCHFFWTDERPVAPDHPDSNYRMTWDAMLRRVAVPEGNIHRIQGEKPPEDAASNYEEELRTFFTLKNDERPAFDLVLLGLGEDGHTASIFPGTEVLNETTRLVAAPWVPKLNSHRITLTLPVLNNAATTIFLVSGDSKARILHEVLEGKPAIFPSQAIQPTSGKLVWLVDSAAAARLHTTRASTTEA